MPHKHEALSAIAHLLHSNLDTYDMKTAILFTDDALGRRQVVRQRVLVSPSLGSNPSAPVLDLS